MILTCFLYIINKFTIAIPTFRLKMFSEQLADTQAITKYSLFSVGQNSFMIELYNAGMCITYDRSDNLKAKKCNSSDPFQEWIWTRHNQLLHVDTLKCIQQEQEYSGTDYTLHLGLKECDISETKQKWNCNSLLLEKPLVSPGQKLLVRIAHKMNTILAKVGAGTQWRRYKSMNEKICSSRMLPSINVHPVFYDYKCLLKVVFLCPPIYY